MDFIKVDGTLFFYNLNNTDDNNNRMRRPALALAAREAFPDGVSQPVGAWADGILIHDFKLALGTLIQFMGVFALIFTFVGG